MKILDYAPRYINELLDEIESKGHEAYVVGGCIRDYVLGLTPKDYDIATSANPEKIIEIFKESKLSCVKGVVPTGLAHGTVTIITEDEGYKDSVEITTFRTDGEYKDNRRPEEVFYAQSIEEDLKRRDFTMNAIAFSKEKGLVDIFNGMKDIDEGLVRSVGDPNERFVEDALRMLRAVRFAVTLGFSIEHETFIAAKSNSHLIKNISKERIRDELCKMLASSDPPKAMVMMKNIGALHLVVPELKASFGYDQNSKYHRYDLFTHTLKTLEYSHSLSYSLPGDTRLLVKLAALLHDIAKPAVRTIGSEGHAHYYGHESLSSEFAYDYLKRYKFDNALCERVKKIIDLHMIIMKDTKNINAVNARRLLSRFTEEEVDGEVDLPGALFVLQIADTLAKGFSYDDRVKSIEDFRNETYKEKALGNPVREKDLKINGDDLINMGIEEGIAIGLIKKHLIEWVIKDPERNEFDVLTEEARKFYEEEIVAGNGAE